MASKRSRRSFCALVGGIGTASAIGGAGTAAYFTDEETSTGTIRAASEFPSTVRINCGGPEYTTNDGQVFEADDANSYYTGGNTTTIEDDIAGTDDDPLYQSERYGNADGFGYEIDVANAVYDVHLHFAEIWWGDDGNGGGNESRVFDLAIEGTEELTDYDIHQQVGHDAALVESFQAVQVTDGQLEITTTTSTDNAKFSAIEVVPSSVSVPPAPTNLSSPAHDSSSVDLDWDGPTDTGGSPMDHYTVYVDGTNDQDVVAGTTTTTVSDLLPGTTYDFAVIAVNDAGVESDESNTVTQTTDDGPGPVAYWPLDTRNGTTTPDAANSYDASLVNSASVEPGRDDSVLSLNMDDEQYADAEDSVLDTSGDYSVAAWVRFGDISDFRTAVSQDGGALSAFYLQYRQDEDALAFACHPADDTNTTAVMALGDTPTLDQWYHLTGVHDAGNDELRLYVNGALADATDYSSGFTAGGNTVLGRALWNGNEVDYFQGMLDDVRLYDRVLGPGEISDLSQQ